MLFHGGTTLQLWDNTLTRHHMLAIKTLGIPGIVYLSLSGWPMRSHRPTSITGYHQYSWLLSGTWWQDLIINDFLYLSYKIWRNQAGMHLEASITLISFHGAGRSVLKNEIQCLFLASICIDTSSGTWIITLLSPLCPHPFQANPLLGHSLIYKSEFSVFNFEEDCCVTIDLSVNPLL